MSFDYASAQFRDNMVKFNPTSCPEKYNLYPGLLNITEGLKKLQREVQQIKGAVDYIQPQVMDRR